MTWFWVLLPVLIALAYLLLAPFYVEINTASDLYRVRFHRLVSTALLITGEGLQMDLRIARWKKRIDLLAPRKSARNEKKKPAKKPAGRKHISFRTIWAVIKTFKVNRFFLTADTGDPALNGKVFPVVYAVSVFTGQNLSVNFSGRNELILDISNNLARVLRAFIYSSLKTRTWKT
ncbi:MAG: hypothetical protein JST19_02770 [Bacteroidetes bacterium]|nr:hypothetical protein [Bacteroidota bacterium]